MHVNTSLAKITLDIKSYNNEVDRHNGVGGIGLKYLKDSCVSLLLAV